MILFSFQDFHSESLAFSKRGLGGSGNNSCSSLFLDSPSSTGINSTTGALGMVNSISSSSNHLHPHHSSSSSSSSATPNSHHHHLQHHNNSNNHHHHQIHHSSSSGGGGNNVKDSLGGGGKLPPRTAISDFFGKMMSFPPSCQTAAAMFPSYYPNSLYNPEKGGEHMW